MSPSPTSAKSPPQQKDPFERDRARMNRYREYADFYDGVQWLGKPRRGEKRLVINYARALVRKVVSYVLSGPTGFSVPAPVLAPDANASDDAPDDEAPEGPDLVQAQSRAGEA